VSSLIDIIKTNIGKIAFGSIGTIITLIAALFAVDERYAHAADVQQDKQQIQSMIQESSQTLRRQMLEDKLFELDIKKAQAKNQQLPPVDAALRDRYQRQLEEISKTKTKPVM
jgi:biopolymer transport protein ExbB/TolQ